MGVTSVIVVETIVIALGLTVPLNLTEDPILVAPFITGVVIGVVEVVIGAEVLPIPRLVVLVIMLNSPKTVASSNSMVNIIMTLTSTATLVLFKTLLVPVDRHTTTIVLQHAHRW